MRGLRAFPLATAPTSLNDAEPIPAAAGAVFAARQAEGDQRHEQDHFHEMIVPADGLTVQHSPGEMAILREVSAHRLPLSKQGHNSPAHAQQNLPAQSTLKTTDFNDFWRAAPGEDDNYVYAIAL